jgi:lipid II isoglutaminyl synthase (glutamine-hydrolysing)
MRLFVTLALSKLSAVASRRFTGGSGQALPGLVAERLDPHLARRLAHGLEHGVILVTGTNGKTTTTKMITAMLEASGERVLSNTTGSNLKRGVTAALIQAANLRGRLPYTIGVFEVDEASLRHVAPELLPREIVVLNLFRDQLDRYGELDTTAALIGQGIAATQANLHLNADDPLVASLANYIQGEASVRFFGVEGLPVVPSAAPETPTDSDRCPLCRSRLVFSRVFYGHIGHFRCPTGDFNRPQPEVSVTHVDEATLAGTKLTLAIRGRRYEVSYPLPGTYNIYNALAATSLAEGLGLPTATTLKALEATQAAFGRVERVSVHGRVACLLLIKNPAGFTQVLETFLLGRKGLKILLIINDLDADGRDVSWLWDVGLEALKPYHPEVIVAGIRATDMALRLKYAGIVANVVEDPAVALDKLLQLAGTGEEVYVLPTYTAMTNFRKVLSKITQIEPIS